MPDDLLSLTRAGLDVGSLRLLQAIFAHGTLTAAAGALGTSQPAVSQHVRRLERRLGTALLVRSGRTVRLTEAGEVLARHGETVTAAVRAASAEVAALIGLEAGVVRLVAFPSACATLVPRALAPLQVDHPGLRVTLEELEPPESVGKVRAGECDVALAFTYGGAPEGEADGLTVEPILVDDTLVALRADDPRAERPGLQMGDLADETWIAGCPRCRTNLLDASHGSGYDPQIAYATDDYSAVLALVAAGLGVALLPRLVTEIAERHRGVVLRPIAGAPARTIEIVTTPDLMRVPAVAAVASALRAAASA